MPKCVATMVSVSVPDIVAVLEGDYDWAGLATAMAPLI
jgi:hypothetical protein